MDNKTIDIITTITSEIVKEQTAREWQDLIEAGQHTFDAAQIAAEIAVKLFMRIAGIETAARRISPVDAFVDQAEAQYRANYAG